MSVPLRRGDVVMVRLDPAVGREIRKTRPAVVVSNDVACTMDAVVQTVPLTALAQRPLRPYESLVGSHASGVKKKCRAVANQVRTVAKERIGTVVGRLSSDELRALEQAIAIQLGLHPLLRDAASGRP
jgi:mRNA interferase MazF